ncbi:tape measure protein [Paucilactobacillus sp. N302-9]
MGNADKSLNGVGKAAESATSSIMKIATGIGAVKVLTAGIDLIKSSVSGAVKRIDTLNNSSRVFQNMGYSTKDTKAAMDALTKSIQGMPTALDDGVQGVQLLASSVGDIGKSEQIFAALNDGILGFGGSTDQVTNAIRQLSQAFAGGKVDAETWNSMLDSGLGPALNAIAKQMGITSAALKSGLSDGSISVAQFQDALIDLDKNGGGGLASLHQIAMDALGGISTSMTNAKTAVTRGVASIISAIDQGLAANNMPTIAQGISSAGSLMEAALNKVASVIPGVITQISNFTHGLIPIAPAIKVVSAGMAVLVAAIMGAGQIVPVITMFTQFGGAVSKLGSLVGALGGPIGIAIAVVLALGAAFAVVYSKSEPLRKAVANVGNAFSTAFGPAIQAAISSIKGFISSLTGISGNIDTIISKVGSGLANALNSIPWDAVAQGAAGVFQGIITVVGIVVDVIKSIVDAVSGVVQGFNSVGGASAVWSILSTVISGIGDIFNIIVATVKGVVDAFTNISGATSAWQTLGQILGTIANVIAAILPIVVTVITTIITIIGQVVVTIANVMATIFSVISTVMTTIWTTIQPIILAIINLWNTIAPIVTIVWNMILSVITTVINVIMTVITTVMTVISTTWTTIWNVISTVVSTVWNIIMTVITTVINVIAGIIQAVLALIQGDWSGAWTAIQTVASTIWNAIVTIVTTLINAVKSIITSVLNGIKGIWTSIWNGIKSVASTVWNAIKSVISSAINAAKSIISSAMSAIKSAMTSAWNAIKSATSSAWNSFKSIISNGISSAVSRIKGFVSSMKSAGQDLVRGFIKGIQSMIKTAVSTAENLGKSAVGAVKKFLHIGSPSKVMAKMGMWTGMGFVNGMKGMLKPIDRMSNAMAASALPDVQKIDFTPTFNANKLNTQLKKAGNMLNSKLGTSVDQELSLSNNWTVNVPVNLDGETIATVTASPMQRVLDQMQMQTNRIHGNV